MYGLFVSREDRKRVTNTHRKVIQRVIKQRIPVFLWLRRYELSFVIADRIHRAHYKACLQEKGYVVETFYIADDFVFPFF